MTEAGADRVAVEVVTALEAARIPCAIGGALSLGFWSVPRGTNDADVNAFVGEERFQELLSVLARAGVAFDHETALRQAREGDAVVGWKDGFRVDVFVPTIPFYAEAERRIRRVTLLGRSVPVLAPEVLAVFKLLFFRDKDLVDLRALVATQGAALDAAWVRAQLVAMLGPGDERVPAWDGIVGTHGPRV